MIIHPPMLYMGYVGFSVAFAFAIAALLGGRARRAPGRAGRGRGPRAAWIVPHPRHRARQLVGVLRARLGRLVVLGSGRERLLHALARRHRADPFAGGHREARQLQELDACCWRSSRSRCPARHLPGALRRADLGARLRHRSAARPLHPRLPGASSSAARWRCTPGARRRVGPRRAASPLLSRETLLLANNVLLRRGRGVGAARHALSAALDALGWARSRSGRPTSTRCSCR